MVDHSKDDEESWQAALKELQLQVTLYKEEKRKPENETSLQQAEGRLIEGMKRVGDSHPDPKIRNHWEEQARAFEGANEKEKENILRELGRGILILLAVPFALAAAVIFGAGAIVYGVGTFIKGLGNLMTGGMLGS